MKRICCLFVVFLLLFLNISFADEDESLNNEDYSLLEEYESYNLYAKVIEAGEEEKMNDGYSEYIVQKVRIKILDKKFENK